MVWCFLSGISRKTTMFYFRKQVISETSCNIHPILKIVSNLVLTNHNLEIYLDLENGIAYVMLWFTLVPLKIIEVEWEFPLCRYLIKEFLFQWLFAEVWTNWRGNFFGKIPQSLLLFGYVSLAFLNTNYEQMISSPQKGATTTFS